MLLPAEQQPLAIGRPVNRRRRGAGWRALGEAPSARGQPLRFSAFCGENPEVRGQFRFGGQEIVVTDLECIVMFFDLLLVLRLVGSDVSDLLAVGSPGKLLDAVRRLGNLAGFAAVHRPNENLWLGIFSGPVRGDNRQAVTGR